MGKFAEWWGKKENIDRVKNSLTEGMRFVGIYFVILQTDDHDVEIWYEMDEITEKSDSKTCVPFSKVQIEASFLH